LDIVTKLGDWMEVIVAFAALVLAAVIGVLALYSNL
jgi:hypothetical protein